MVQYILFSDPIRQEEIDTFYTACQMHRDYYRGYPKSYHPLTFFREPEYMWQCPSEMTQVYLRFPPFHVRYKKPPILGAAVERSSATPTFQQQSLVGRFNKPACKAFVR